MITTTPTNTHQQTTRTARSLFHVRHSSLLHAQPSQGENQKENQDVI